MKTFQLWQREKIVGNLSKHNIVLSKYYECAPKNYENPFGLNYFSYFWPLPYPTILKRYAVYFLFYLCIYFLVVESILIWTNEELSFICTQTWAPLVNQLDKHVNNGDQKGIVILLDHTQKQVCVREKPKRGPNGEWAGNSPTSSFLESPPLLSRVQCENILEKGS